MRSKSNIINLIIDILGLITFGICLILDIIERKEV